MKHFPIASRALNFLRENFVYLAPGVFLFILPFAGTVALRLTTLAVAAIIAIFVWRNTSPPPIPCKPSIALWILVALLSLIWALELKYSIGEIKNEIGYTMIAFLTFYGLTQGAHQWRVWNMALLLGFLALSATATYYFPQGWFAYSAGRHAGSGSVSTYVVLVSPLLFMAMEKSISKPAWRFPTCGLLVFGLADGYMSMNRAFWFALPIAAIAYTGLRLFRHTDRARALKLTVVVSLTMLLLGGMLLFAVIGSRFSTGTSVGASLEVIARDPRLELWGFTLRHIWSHPFIGSGFGIGSSHAVLAAQNFEDPQLWHAHNTLLNYGLQLGIPGMLAALFLFFLIAWEYIILYRSDDDTCSTLGAAGLAMLAGVLCKSMTDVPIGRHNALLFWSLTGMILGYGRRIHFGGKIPAV